jgi:hypothetical protein
MTPAAPAAPITALSQLDANERYQLAGEYYEPGPIPSRTLPGLALEWTEVFAEA